MDEADEVEQVWGPLMNREPGHGAHDIVRACAEHRIDVLFCVGVDPLRDLPDAELAARALANVDHLVVQSLELGSLEAYASAFLPAAPFLEKEGHVTTWEGRGQRLRPVRGAQGISLPDWEIFASMALACGGDLGFESLDELHDEMGPLLSPREVVFDDDDPRAGPAAPTPSHLQLCHLPTPGRRGPLVGGRRRA